MFLIHFILKTLFNSLFISSVMTLTFNVFSAQALKFGPIMLITALNVVHKQLDKDQIRNEDPNSTIETQWDSESDNKVKLNKIIDLGSQIYRKIASDNKLSIDNIQGKLNDIKINPIESYNNKMLEQKRILDEINQSAP